jgi:uncharacterized protein (TIGR03118 family)
MAAGGKPTDVIAHWKVARAMKHKIAAKFFLFLMAGFLLIASGTSAQSIAYRQTNLTSDVPGFANNTDPFLRNPWGIAVVPGLSFFVANAGNGRAIQLDAAGSRIGPAGFIVPNPTATGPAIPTGIVSDSNFFFRSGGAVPPFNIATIAATEDGGIYYWEENTDGIFLQQAPLVVDHSRQGAVYTALAILTPDCCAPFLAVANFHSGLVETYTTTFDPLATPGSFADPSLPPGFSPYGMQVIGKQLFVAYALQDAARHDPVFGAGNGIVGVFDLEGHFVRRFATAGSLNTPWGITQASANFGPFSRDFLIGNVGDGAINAFDPVTGNFAGQIKDGDGNIIVNAGLHGLAFRSDGFGDPNTLYFTAGISDGSDGVFGALAPGLVSTTRISIPDTPANTPSLITVTVSAGPGNSGNPKGDVALQDGTSPISDVPITNGVILFDTVLRGVGTHVIGARYLGDDTFLPSFAQTEAHITGPATTLRLAAPADVAPGSPVTLTATINSTGGTPTGQIVFHDGNTDLGSSRLNATGVATLTINILTAGAHSLTASYSGDGSFGASTSPPVTTTIASRDFSLGATPQAATVTAGQSTIFNVSVMPAGGFADPVAFSCPVLAGITCSFNPPMVTPNAGVATTMLTVTTSSNVPRFGQIPGVTGSGLLFASLGLIGILAMLNKKTSGTPIAFLRLTASALTVFALAFALVSCGGYTANGQTNRGTASITVTAQSGALSHTTSVSVTVQ